MSRRSSRPTRRSSDESLNGRGLDADPARGRIFDVTLRQDDRNLAVSAAPFKPLSISVRGELFGAAKRPDLVLCITRVDGRRIWQERLSAAGPALNPRQVYRHRTPRSARSRGFPLPPRRDPHGWSQGN